MTGIPSADETEDLLSTPGVLDEIRAAEAEIARAKRPVPTSYSGRWSSALVLSRMANE